MSSNAVVRASRLGKSYRIYERPSDRLSELLLRGPRRGTDFWALQDVDLTVSAGEAVGIVGRNGSGKSTLLQLVCGLSRPSTGDVAVRGRVAGLLELGAGFNPDFTGRENAQLTAAILGLRADDIAARLPAIEAFAGIGAYMDRPLREYSSGMYARLAFSVCVHVDADILVIDEILSVGDAAFQQKCMRHLRQFQADGGTLLFVSHSEASVLALCERAIWLERGELQFDGPSGEACRRYATAMQDSGDTFQTGGRPKSPPAPTPHASPAYRSMPAPDALFDFDPDAADETGGAVINNVGFYSENGARVTAAEVGEKLALRIDCSANVDLKDVVVAFVVRNRLGRPVFSDDTSRVDRYSDQQTAAGQSFSARFRFHLPFLQSDDHSIEAFVFAGAASARRLQARSVDSHFLSVYSQHVGGGLANIPVIEATLETTAKARDDADVF